MCTPYSARNEHVRQHMYTPAMPASLKVNVMCATSRPVPLLSVMFLHCPPRLSIAVRLDNRSPRPVGLTGHGSEYDAVECAGLDTAPPANAMQLRPGAHSWSPGCAPQHGWTEPGRGSHSVHTCVSSPGPTYRARAQHTHRHTHTDTDTHARALSLTHRQRVISILTDA